MKILNKLHPCWNDHNHDKSERRKEYKRSPNLIVCPHFREGSTARAFPHSEHKFKDHWKKKKAKQQTLHKIEQLLPSSQNTCNQFHLLKKHTCIIIFISLVLLPYCITSDLIKNPEACFSNLTQIRCKYKATVYKEKKSYQKQKNNNLCNSI